MHERIHVGSRLPQNRVAFVNLSVFACLSFCLSVSPSRIIIINYRLNDAVRGVLNPPCSMPELMLQVSMNYLPASVNCVCYSVSCLSHHHHQTTSSKPRRFFDLLQGMILSALSQLGSWTRHGDTGCTRPQPNSKQPRVHCLCDHGIGVASGPSLVVGQMPMIDTMEHVACGSISTRSDSDVRTV